MFRSRKRVEARRQPEPPREPTLSAGLEWMRGSGNTLRLAWNDRHGQWIGALVAHPGKLLRVPYGAVITGDVRGATLRPIAPTRDDSKHEAKLWVKYADGSEPWFNRDGAKAVTLTRLPIPA